MLVRNEDVYSKAGKTIRLVVGSGGKQREFPRARLLVIESARGPTSVASWPAKARALRRFP